MAFVDCCLVIVKGFIRDMECLNLVFQDEKRAPDDYLDLFKAYEKNRREQLSKNFTEKILGKSKWQKF